MDLFGMDLDCVPCGDGSHRLSDEEIDVLMQELPAWQLETIDGRSTLVREFRLNNDDDAEHSWHLIVNLFEEEEHRASCQLEGNRLRVEIATHGTDLHVHDFIFAAKTDAIIGFFLR